MSLASLNVEVICVIANINALQKSIVFSRLKYITQMKKTYTGSCHCGEVRFEADIDLKAGTNKCNCTICTKTRNWNAIIKPDAFRLLAGENALLDYQFGRKIIHHLFCRYCGVRLFAQGYAEAIGGNYVGIQLAVLDNVELQELISAPIRYADGQNNHS
jgi:hypothetical protein